MDPFVRRLRNNVVSTLTSSLLVIGCCLYVMSFNSFIRHLLLMLIWFDSCSLNVIVKWHGNVASNTHRHPVTPSIGLHQSFMPTDQGLIRFCIQHTIAQPWISFFSRHFLSSAYWWRDLVYRWLDCALCVGSDTEAHWYSDRWLVLGKGVRMMCV